MKPCKEDAERILALLRRIAPLLAVKDYNELYRFVREVTGRLPHRHTVLAAAEKRRSDLQD